MHLHSEEEGQEELLLERLTHWPKVFPQSLGGALQQGPLLLEEILQACVCGLWVLASHPQHRLDPTLPLLYLLTHPLRLWCGTTDITPQVTFLRDYDETPTVEKSLCPRNVMHGYDQDTIGQLQKHTLGGPCDIMLSKWSRMRVKVLTALA